MAPDLKLVVGGKADDTRAALRELYAAYGGSVFGRCQYLLRDRVKAEDAMQDVFLVVHRRLAEFEGRAKLSTWLFGICLRVAKDHRRMAHVRLEVLDDSNFASFVDPKADTGAIAEQRERLLMFDAALEDP